ncbi:MAG: fibronectin type III domain-containing protein [Planctomycetes bacterium]|nr:fibronectin type III domain-containing protein [Planctomycetota bacterium]MCL4731800.1 fibronectin type III domain-containing protein [Planctomycetota bacterium]
METRDRKTLTRRVAPHAAVLLLAILAALAGALTTPESLAADNPGFPDAGAAEPAGKTPAQWRVIWGENPSRRAVISWSTSEATEANTVYYDTVPRKADLAAYRHKAQAGVNGRYTSRGHKLHYHHTVLEELAPNTTYFFCIGSDGQFSRELHFITAPADDADVKFLYGGDSRSDRAGRRAMNQRMRALFQADPAILCLVHGGDYIHDGDDMAQWSEWLTDHELTVTAGGRVLPVVPARGNHEAGDVQYDEVWADTGGRGKNYFRTMLAAQVMIVNLNTEISAGGDQARWLEDTLRDAAGVRWQIANYHRPAWPAVKQASAAKQHWVPLFEKYNLDVAFESDGHVIKRTVAIRGDKADPTGVVYIGEGGLGVKQRTPDPKRWYFDGGITGSASHLQKVTVTRDQLKVETILHDGRVFDTWQTGPRKRD